ncbi:ADP-ribosylglycohydrolase family protein [Reticulomyxa filosa]|uniref:ADP-ribosylglycohydrolase family protein n=1 Tax=Reticulomyxa filosa TaxID=46433 RepID=X6MFB9_RETFI|nr:ADP-ribosylglycohydrolase family protein [Reticulomyxa filosa]|eukprot:ETO12589.1 ADP-ribosylglycohydrolase family protein [Reticulomyxa filosa]
MCVNVCVKVPSKGEKLNPFWITFGKYSKKSKELVLSRALGLCYGGAIGDSMGSYMKLGAKDLNESIVDKAMEMSGESCRYSQKMSSGQTTDASEMAMCVARGLLHMTEANFRRQEDSSQQQQQVTMRYIVQEYKIWKQTNPVDRSAWVNRVKNSDDLDMIRKKALDNNEMLKKESKLGVTTNGSLIRVMPLIVYTLRLPADTTFELIRLESSLTHASHVVYYAITAYALTAQYLLRFPCQDKRHEHAINFALEFLNEQLKCADHTQMHNRAISEVKSWIDDAVSIAKKNNNNNSSSSSSSPFLYSEKWIKDRINLTTAYVQDQPTHIKTGLQLAFYHLYLANSFEQVMKETLSFGGAANNNCCIVGGLLGALHGIDHLAQFRSKIDNWKPSPETSTSAKREPYQAKHYAEYLPLLLKFALHPRQHKIADTVPTL